jgi:hypothetical protein
MEPKTVIPSLTSKAAFTTFLENLKPWAVFFKPSEFNYPREPGHRVQENLRHFWANYAVVMATLLFLGVLSQPSFLLTLVILGGCWLLMNSFNFTVFGREYTPTQKNVAMLCGGAVVTLFVAGVTVLCVLGLTSVSVGLHALFHEQPKEEYEYQV